jgi:hypothetical protein
VRKIIMRRRMVVVEGLGKLSQNHLTPPTKL